jgi:hypothetical protein
LFYFSVQVVSSSEDVLDGRPTKYKDSNRDEDWQIWPTSVNIDPISDVSSSVRKVNSPHNVLPADVGDISSFLRRGKHYYQPSDEKLSRDEVILDLLEPAEVHGRKVHVEDFLWTGSGKKIHFKILLIL